jgi:hypothetical protein
MNEKMIKLLKELIDRHEYEIDKAIENDENPDFQEKMQVAIYKSFLRFDDDFKKYEMDNKDSDYHKMVKYFSKRYIQ